MPWFFCPHWVQLHPCATLESVPWPLLPPRGVFWQHWCSLPSSPRDWDPTAPRTGLTPGFPARTHFCARLDPTRGCGCIHAV